MLVKMSFIWVKIMIKIFSLKNNLLKCRNFLQIFSFQIAFHKFNVFYVVNIMEIINHNAQKSFSI